MSDGETEDWLEQEIRNQIRTVSDVRADLESGEDGAEKYVTKVAESVLHLEALAEPLKDDKFETEEYRPTKSNTEMLQRASDRFKQLVKLFHRKGVL